MRRRAAECSQGHPYTEDNTAYRANGARSCRTCAANRWQGTDGHPTQEPPPPPDWMDWVVVHRLVTGRDDPGRKPTEAEQVRVAAHLMKQGQGVQAVCLALRCSSTKAHALIADADAAATGATAATGPAGEVAA
jgi:hypothetical protein